MADVDLSVAVTSSGVESAIAKINDLRASGLRTGEAVNSLSRSVARANSEFTKAFAGSSVTAPMKNAEGAVRSLTAALSAQEKEYRAIAALNVGATPAQRLANGFGTLDQGKAAAKQIQQMREAYSADPVRDLMAVQREELALLERRSQKLADLASKQAAQGGLSRAREDLRNQQSGITAVEQAQLRLKRATEDLTRAEAASAAVKGVARGADGRFVSQTVAQTEALRNEARAVQEVTAATRELGRAQESANDHGNAFQSSFSYFIIAGMAQQVTQSILAMGGAAVTATSEIERSFADVERTFEGTGGELVSLQARLAALATETPISVIDLAEIATLGNQLGVASRDIQSFTQTIAQYTAVSGQSAEDAATAFGRISNLTGLAANQYSNLASAITYVARTSVATESTIQNTAKEITALASGSGFSADAIVGLAGALSSLAIPPERARGALSLYFGALNESVAEGGPKLAAFATLTGKTTDELSRLVRENRGQEVFTSFIKGLSELDSVAKTSALDTLGLSTIRVDQTMRALAQNVPLVTSSFEGANKAFTENTEIANQYGIIQETLASKIIEFQNAMQLAAGAAGSALEPALKQLLDIATDLLVNFTAFANSPFGQWVLGITGAVTALILVMASLIGALALIKAGLVVIPWALTGLGANTANTSIARFAAGLLGMNLAVTNGTVGLTRMNGVLSATGATSAAATAGFTALKFAIAATGIGLAVTLVGTLIASLDQAGQASTITADKVSGLADALKADTATYEKTGEKIAIFSSKTGETTAEQEAAAAASKNWANVLGNDLVTGAEAAAEAVEKIAAGDQVVEAIRAALGQDEAIKAITSDSSFASTWRSLGLDMTELIAQGIEGGDINDQFASVLKEAGITSKRIKDEFGSYLVYTDAQGNDVTKFSEGLFTIIKAAGGSNAAIQGLANSTSVLESGIESVDVDPLTDGFLGATDSLTKFQGAVSSGVGKFVGFSDVLESVKAAAKAMAEETEDDSFLTSMVNVGAFKTELDAASGRATEFFNGIKSLADSGATTFAAELASLGPEASGILGSALSDPAGLAALEASARFAGFLASTEFTAALNEGMTDSNAAYGRIFSATGDLSQVQSYIAAQVAGTGAEWEKQWAINHPDLPLNVTPTLSNPTDSEVEMWKQANEGRLTITPKIISDRISANEYTDNATGAKITLPAQLDGAALSDSLTIWQQNQNASPEDLAAKLNEAGLSASLDSWVASNGPVTIQAIVVPTVSESSLATVRERITRVGTFAQGGQVPAPKFASGGGYGQFRGPGSGTSDSIWARVSAGEFINTADSTRFWGSDFFDSLNKKMLPSSFVNMLGRAAVSGNQGPQSVTNVNISQVNPVVRDNLKQLREDSEMVAAGIWG